MKFNKTTDKKKKKKLNVVIASGAATQAIWGGGGSGGGKDRLFCAVISNLARKPKRTKQALWKYSKSISSYSFFLG